MNIHIPSYLEFASENHCDTVLRSRVCRTLLEMITFLFVVIVVPSLWNYVFALFFTFVCNYLTLCESQIFFDLFYTLDFFFSIVERFFLFHYINFRARDVSL